MSAEAEQKHTLVGMVVSDSRDKTRKVKVDWSTRHPRYHRVIRKHTILHIHDENNECANGDKVRIVECRPVSKTKAYKLVEVLEKASI